MSCIERQATRQIYAAHACDCSRRCVALAVVSHCIRIHRNIRIGLLDRYTRGARGIGIVWIGARVRPGIVIGAGIGMGLIAVDISQPLPGWPVGVAVGSLLQTVVDAAIQVVDRGLGLLDRIDHRAGGIGIAGIRTGERPRHRVAASLGLGRRSNAEPAAQIDASAQDRAAGKEGLSIAGVRADRGRDLDLGGHRHRIDPGDDNIIAVAAGVGDSKRLAIGRPERSPLCQAAERAHDWTAAIVGKDRDCLTNRGRSAGLEIEHTAPQIDRSQHVGRAGRSAASKVAGQRIGGSARQCEIPHRQAAAESTGHREQPRRRRHGALAGERADRLTGNAERHVPPGADRQRAAVGQLIRLQQFKPGGAGAVPHHHVADEGIPGGGIELKRAGCDRRATGERIGACKRDGAAAVLHNRSRSGQNGRHDAALEIVGTGRQRADRADARTGDIGRQCVGADITAVGIGGNKIIACRGHRVEEPRIGSAAGIVVGADLPAGSIEQVEVGIGERAKSKVSTLKVDLERIASLERHLPKIPVVVCTGGDFTGHDGPELGAGEGHKTPRQIGGQAEFIQLEPGDAVVVGVDLC